MAVDANNTSNSISVYTVGPNSDAKAWYYGISWIVCIQPGPNSDANIGSVGSVGSKSRSRAYRCKAWYYGISWIVCIQPRPTSDAKAWYYGISWIGCIQPRPNTFASNMVLWDQLDRLHPTTTE
eukprot:889847_1